MLDITQIPASRIPLIDERTGLLSRQWYRFFYNLYVLTGGGSNAITLEELQLGPPNQPDFTEILKEVNNNISPEYQDQSGNFLATLDAAQLMAMMARFENLEAAIQGAYLQPPPTIGTVTAVTGTAPVVSSGGTAPAISMPVATALVDGYLSSTDWATFNAKQPAGSYLVSGGALGTPSSGTVTNLTGTASININGTVGATTAATGAFTTVRASSRVNTDTLNNAANSAGIILRTGATTVVGNSGSALVVPDSGAVTIGAGLAVTGTISPSDNIVQVTAAKGVNFTANTPAAGMTSQLLNWYEEGTWTPTVTSSIGSITSYSAAGRYTKIGRQVTLTWYIAVSNNGTGAGAILVAGAPFAAAVSNTALFGFNQSNNNALTGAINGTSFEVYSYAALYPVATGQTINCSITYSV